MEIELSDRVQRIQPSPTLAVSALAAQLRAEGRDIVGLGAGEPDFDTPEHIKQAAVDALARGETKYTPVDGTVSLKAAIIRKFDRDNGLTFTPDQILVSSGGKQSIFNLCQALLNPGDEVVIPAPYWVSYPDIALLAGARPVVVSAEQEAGFRITGAQLEAAITPNTRLVFLNSPSNPTGAAYSAEQLTELAEVLRRHPRVVIATDDMYEHILFGSTPFVNIVNVAPDLLDRTVVLNGVSKAYAMTGWRIGYAGGPKNLIAAMKKIQSQSTSNPTSIAQAGAEAALDGDQDCVVAMCSAFAERARRVVDGLNAIDGIECLMPDGTFYCFPRVTGLMQAADIDTDVALTKQLLDEVGVALVPGSAFGAPGHVRVSFATSVDQLDKALERLRQFVANHS
ncbi:MULTISPECIES: pyridoxal phosphate-dependent aminotransferase [unclassified Thioalkalivibrio]|uniref:pyridoxal phosphate-dependent aminotransferase n=1 Tax=unclassified Thioalkalivibrio TaxID=2621013 RepID=UPI00037A97BD|nr:MULTISPECIES: pyridoxal phosphate-dependent aminotransferase [unclassified Thioalkalivibrio]